MTTTLSQDIYRIPYQQIAVKKASIGHATRPRPSLSPIPFGLGIEIETTELNR